MGTMASTADFSEQEGQCKGQHRDVPTWTSDTNYAETPAKLQTNNDNDHTEEGNKQTRCLQEKTQVRGQGQVERSTGQDQYQACSTTNDDRCYSGSLNRGIKPNTRHHFVFQFRSNRMPKRVATHVEELPATILNVLHPCPAILEPLESFFRNKRIAPTKATDASTVSLVRHIHRFFFQRLPSRNRHIISKLFVSEAHFCRIYSQRRSNR